MQQAWSSDTNVFILWSTLAVAPINAGVLLYVFWSTHASGLLYFQATGACGALEYGGTWPASVLLPVGFWLLSAAFLTQVVASCVLLATRGLLGGEYTRVVVSCLLVAVYAALMGHMCIFMAHGVGSPECLVNEVAMWSFPPSTVFFTLAMCVLGAASAINVIWTVLLWWMHWSHQATDKDKQQMSAAAKFPDVSCMKPLAAVHTMVRRSHTSEQQHLL